MADRAVWVTGAAGFVGRRLLQQLREAGRWALVLDLIDEDRIDGHPARRLDLAEAALVPHGGEVLELDGLPEPTGLIHLAAIAFPPACENDPELARAVNATGPARLYEHLLSRWSELPILHVSTAQVYRPKEEPLAEDDPVEPVNVYGSTKLQGEAVALGLRDRGHRVTVVRPFNHTGPGQAPLFALPSFALRLAALEREGGGELAVGSLDRERDFLHVDEVVRTYLDLLPHAGREEILNVCSGTPTSIRGLLEGLLARARGSVKVREESARKRGAKDPARLVGDATRLERVLGRKPGFRAEELLDDLMRDARQRVAAGEDLAHA